MKNKVVRKLLMVGLSSSVVLTSTVGVTAASMDATTTDVVVENAAEDEVLTPVADEDALAEEETTEETGEEETEETVEETGEEETEETVTTYAAETRTFMINYVLEDGTNVGTGSITVAADATELNVEDLTAPFGYKLLATGVILLPAEGTELNITVAEKSVDPTETRKVEITFLDQDNASVGKATVEIFADEEYVDPTLVTLPEGYVFANEGPIYVGAANFVTVKIVKASEEKEEKTFMINYVLEDGTNVGTGSVTVAANATELNLEDLTDVPYGYKLLATGSILLPAEGTELNITVAEKNADPLETREVEVTFLDQDNNEAGKTTVVIFADEEYIDPAVVTLPEGYEFANEGPIYVGAANFVTVKIVKVSEEKNLMINYVLEDGSHVGTGSITVAADATELNVEDLTDVPYGYKLLATGSILLPAEATEINVTVVEKSVDPLETREVEVTLLDQDNNEVGKTTVVIFADEEYIDPAVVTLPEGYAFATEEPIYVGAANFVTVNIVKLPEEKTVMVNYVLEDGTNVGTGSITIGVDATEFDTKDLNVPYGYETLITGTILISKEAVSIDVTVREKAYQRDVTVNYVDEEGNPVLTSTIKLHNNLNYFNTSILTDVPYGWVLAIVGDIPVENNTATVVVRQKNYTKDVVVNYVDEKGNPVFTSSIRLDDTATYFNTSILTDVPYGWELAIVGDLPINDDNTVDVVVREKEYKRDVVINYVDEEGNSVATSGIKLDMDATYFNTSILTDVPYGWELAIVGDIPVDFETNSANVVVREKEYQRDVVINYVDEEGNSVATSGIKLDMDATYFNTSILTDVPYGWEIAIVGDIPVDFETNSANVVVREKVYQRDVVINYVDEEGNSVATSGIKLDMDATYFNTSILTDVPYGWELAIVGDIPVDFETNSANVVVREKEYQRDVVINYVDEEGNSVATSGIKLDMDATYFNTSILTDVPYGWEIAIVGDIPVDFETNSANVVVRQKEYTRDVTVKYVTEDGEEVGTGTLVVDENDTYINTSILTDVPEGYVIAIVGDLPIEDNTVVVTVRAEVVDPEEPTPSPDPEDPDQPVDPEDPDQPTDPDQKPSNPTVAPEKPNNNNNQNNDQDKADTNKSEVKTNNPKTGDATNTVPLVAGLLGSGSMIGLIQMLRRKKK